MTEEPVKPPPSSIDASINSLIQQTTVLGVALGSIMKHISLSDPNLARQIEVDLFPLLKRLDDKLSDSRTQNMIEMLKSGITEGRRNGDS